MYGKRRYNNVYNNSSSKFRVYKRRKQSNSDVVLKRKIQKVINSNLESKYWDSINDSIISSSGLMIDITTIPQDTSDTGRIGDKLQWTKISGKLWMQAIDPVNAVRVIIFQYNEDDSAAPPSLSLVLKDLAFPIVSPYTKDTGKLYTVLYDRVFWAENDSVGHGSKIDHDNKLEIFPRSGNWAKRHVQFIGGSLNGTGKIYMMAIANSPTTLHPTLQWGLRLNFKDA
jgi:hypothetical protein